MKKTLKLTAFTAIAAISIVGGTHLKSSGNEAKQSDLTLMNLEALTGDEYSGQPCYNKGVYNIKFPLSLECGNQCKMTPLDVSNPSTSFCM